MAKEPAKRSPEAWLTKKGQELLNALSVLDTKQRYLKLRRIAFDVFDQKEMPRLAMGKRWKELSPSQQDQLSQLFFDYFVVTYGSFNFDFSNITFHVDPAVPSGKDLLLKTKIKFRDGKSLLNATENTPFGKKEKDGEAPAENKSIFEVLFALREKGSEYYIRDAKFEGQSVLMFLRNQMEMEYMAASDAKAFLENMRNKINTQYRAAEDLAKVQKQVRNLEKEHRQGEGKMDIQ